MKKNMAVVKSDFLDAIIYNKDNFIMGLENGRNYMIEEEPSPCFNVLATPKNDFLLFYRNSNGTAYISKLLSGGKGESRRLMPSPAFSSSFDCVFTQTEALNTCVFYTLPSNDKNTRHLYATDFSDYDGSIIDTITPMKEYDFYFIPGEIPALVYRSKQKSLTLCVFKGNSFKEQKTYILSQKAENISDISCLQENGKIHICYLSSQMGNSNIVYRHLSPAGLSSPRILTTRKGLVSCLIFMSNDIIFVFGVSKKSAFYTFSKDFGSTFYPSAVYFKQLPVTSKSQYTSLPTEDFKATEVFMNGVNPLLINDFSQPKSEPSPEFTAEDFIRLKTKILNFEKEISERNSQVTEMSKTVSEAQQQNSMLLQQWKNQFDQLQITYDNLQNDFELNKKESTDFKSQIETIKKQRDEKEKVIIRLKQENTALKKAKGILEEEIYRINNNIVEKR